MSRKRSGISFSHLFVISGSLSFSFCAIKTSRVPFLTLQFTCVLLIFLFVISCFNVQLLSANIAILVPIPEDGKLYIIGIEYYSL